MRLTTKGRYAVTAMLDLALHARTGPVSLADISERQTISVSYLEPLFAKIRANMPDTAFLAPLYRSPICIAGNGPDKGKVVSFKY